MKASSKPTISFVIPVYNESRYISGNIGKIDKFCPVGYEVIVVDNGSTDDTVKLAINLGAIVYFEPLATIGNLRNIGAFHAKGQILVFLDADVYLTKEWQCQIEEVVRTITQEDEKLVTGSRCDVADPPSWIEKHWFQGMLKEKANYINSGHLIVSKQLFLKVGGFDETIVTGEDQDFCTRAKKNGAIIVNNSLLRVIHLGYPKDVVEFFRREKWHGLHDVGSCKLFFNSKVGLVSALYMCVLTYLCYNILNLNLFKTLVAFLTTQCVCFLTVVYKGHHEGGARSTFYKTCLYNVYFVARICALKDRFFHAVKGVVVKRWKRN